MSRETQLAKNTIIITISKISTQFINFLLLPVYTALLSTEEFGVVDLLNTYIAFFAPIVTLQMEHALFRYLIDVRKNREEKSKYITTTFFSTIIQSIVYIMLFAIFQEFIQNDYKFFLATNVVANVFASVFLQISRGLGDNTTYAMGNVLRALSAVVLNILLVVVIRLGATGMLFAALFSNILSSVYVVVKKKLYNYIKINAFNKEKLVQLLKYSTPLIPNALSWWIINASDRTIIAAFLGLSSNGIYAAANKFPGVFITVYNIFNLTWTESASLHIDDEDRNQFLSNTINTMFKLFSSICFGIIAFMPFLFSMFINSKFNEAYNHIPILMLGSLFNVVIGLYSVVYIATKQTRKVANTSIIAGIMNIGINLFLVNYIGIYAASISTVLSFFALMMFRYVDVNKNFNVRLNNKIVISSIFMIFLLFFSYYRNNLGENIFALIITIIYSLYVNRKFINNTLKTLKSKIKERHN